MNLFQFKLNSYSDHTWMDQYIAKMGEKGFWEYKTKVYQLLDGMKVGHVISIEAWVKPESFDLWIKIACCFISESQCCYSFNTNYSHIKRNFDAREMERTLAIFRRERMDKEAGGDGGGTESQSGGIEIIPPPKQEV